MKKQLYILVAILVTASMVLAACGATPTAAPATDAPATAAPATAVPTVPAEPITLSIICRCVIGGNGESTANWMLQYVIPQFQDAMAAEGKDVTVELVQFGGSDEELKARYALDLAAGSGSDVMAFDGFWTPEFASAGLIKPLEAIVGPTYLDWEGWAHIPTAVQQLLTYQGKVYGIPVGTDARVIWYRKDVFKQAGLPDNWQPKSWEELLAAARTIKKALPNVVPLQLNAGTAMGEATTLQGWYMAFLGTGNNVYDFQTNKYPVTGQGFLDTLNLYKTIYVDEKLGDARMQLLPDGRLLSFQGFRDGTVAMLVEGDYFWRSVLAKGGDAELTNRDALVGWAKMPAMSPGKGVNNQDFVTASGGTGFILNPNTKYTAEAWALTSFIFSKDSLNFFSTLQAGIRSRDDVPVPNDPVLTTIAKEMLPLTVTRPPDPAYSLDVSPEIQLMTERVVSGEMTPQQAMEAFAKTITTDVGADKVEATK